MMVRGIGCTLVLLSVVVLGACRTARLLGEDLASDADLNAVHTINLDVLQKLTAFPSCIASCAFVNNGFCDLEASLAQSSDHSELGHNDLHCLPNKMCLWDCLKHKKTPSPAPTTTPAKTTSPAPTTTATPTTTPKKTTTPAPTSTPQKTTTPAPTTTPKKTTTPSPTSTPKKTTTPAPTTTPKKTTTPAPTTTPKGKFCTNPWYPKKPYINVQGCWYEKDTGDGFLDGEAPACDLQGSWQGGWWDSSAPAPLAENGQPEATCCLCNSAANANPLNANAPCNSCPDNQVCIKPKEHYGNGGVCAHPEKDQFVIGGWLDDDASPAGSPTSNQGKHGKGGKFVCGCFKDS